MAIILVAGHTAFAHGAADGERDELLAIFTENRPVYDACYTLGADKVLTGGLREMIVAGSADKRKGMACALGITSSEAGIRVTDGASLDRLQAYFANLKWCTRAEVDLKNARNAIELFYIDNARYPATLAEANASSPVTFASAVVYRRDENQRTYHLPATNGGCDTTVVYDSGAGFSTREKGSSGP